MSTSFTGAPYTKITWAITTANEIPCCNMSLFMKFSHNHVQRKKSGYIWPCYFYVHGLHFLLKLENTFYALELMLMNCDDDCINWGKGAKQSKIGFWNLDLD